jgi:hypothetical protein
MTKMLSETLYMAENTNFDIDNVVLKSFQTYKLCFFGIGLKSIPLTIEKIDVNGIEKSVVMYGKVSNLGTKLELYIMPLQNPIPIAALLGGSIILAALGLTILLLRSVEDISGIVFLTIAVIGYGIYAFKIKKE